MFNSLTRRRLIGLAAVAAMVAVAVPSRALANDDPEYAPPSQPTTIADPQLRAITEDALAAVKYSFAAVAADPDNASYPQDSIEAGMLAGLRSLPQERQALYVERARQLVQASPQERARQFGRHGNHDPQLVRRLGFQGLFTEFPYDREGMVQHIRSRARESEAQAAQTEAWAMQLAEYYRIDPRILHLMSLKKLNLRLDLVKCVDETNGFLGLEWGEDEIDMGGVTLDHKAVSAEVPKFHVGDYDDGEMTVYIAPGKLFSSFDLTTVGTWPRTYTNVIMMAEKDAGGFADMLTEAWEKIKDVVLAEIIEAVVSSLGTGATITQIINDALTEVITFLVNEFVGWIISLFADDLFPPFTYTVELPSRWSWLYTNPAHLGWTSGKLPPVSIFFIGHGGKYKANMHYEVV